MVLLAVVLLPAASGERVSTPPAISPHETLDDPPGLVPAREVGARTPGLRVRTSSYVSIQVNVDPAGFNIVGDAANEPSLAVSPVDTDRFVVGWRQFDTISSNFRQAGWAYTVDAGSTWTFPGVLTPGVFRSDPVLAVDRHGVFYYQSLRSSFDVDVFRSLDGGVTWLSPVAAYGGDKNWLAVDSSGGPGDGQVYGIWQRFAGCCDSEIFTRSIDGGAFFEFPVEVDRSPFFGTMEVGPDGEVYAAGGDGAQFQDLSRIVVSASPDARDSSVSPAFVGTEVDLGGEIGLGFPPNPAGILGQVVVDVDRSRGPSRGNVYVAASVVTDLGGDLADLRISRSVDGGATWSSPITVNDDDSSEHYQWFGAISVAPNGRIDAIWNDTRESGRSDLSRLYYAYSWDRGDTWSENVAVSPEFNSLVGFPSQNKIGDYYDIVADEAGSHVAYAATFNGEQDVYYLRVFPDCNLNAVSDVIDTATGASFDCDFNRIPDECEDAPDCDGAGAVPDGLSQQGEPLRIGRVASGQIVLKWGTSCGPADADYELYQGEIGEYAGHQALLCSTNRLTTAILDADDGDRFFLVVPTNGAQEGSYGRDSAGNERPAGSPACLPQEIGNCLDLGGP